MTAQHPAKVGPEVASMTPAAAMKRKKATSATHFVAPSKQMQQSAQEHPRQQATKDFMWVSTDEPHASRRRQMLKKYPNEIRALMRPEPLTKYVICAMVAVQVASAIYMRDRFFTLEYWVMAYVLGGTLTSSLVLGIHEITHFLAFKSFLPNKILACIANIPIVLPFCVEFKRFHMDHHRFQGVDGLDGDLPTYLEGALFNSTLGKLFFCTFQILFYAIRPKMTVTPRSYRMPQTTLGLIFSWIGLNYVIQFGVMAMIYKFYGFGPILYMAISVLLGGSLHPMAGHFIAEHYTETVKQETYSYYGWLNILAFNVGYHNEHHDFPSIPWTLLPQLRKIAPEFYEDLPQCKSWSGAIYNFIFNSSMGPYARIKRRETVSAAAKRAPDGEVEEM